MKQSIYGGTQAVAPGRRQSTGARSITSDRPWNKLVRMKRKRNEVARDGTMVGGLSLEQEAARYKLGTADIPIGVIGCNDRNRPEVAQHTEDLLTAFKRGSAAWASEKHQMVVECKKGLFDAMLEYLRRRRRDGQLVEVPSFADWAKVNGDERVEMNNGQHRLDAIIRYNALLGSNGDGEGDGEKITRWRCTVYDQEALPDWLRERLRMNRPDMGMKDSHGVIWKQLSTRGIGAEVRDGSKEQAVAYIREELRLGNEVRFPEEKMVTLLRKEKWCAMITRWCNTVFGQRLFEIGRWKWIASMQMDSYWFGLMEEVLDTLARLPEEAQKAMTEEDWEMLAEASGDSAPAGDEARREAMARLFDGRWKEASKEGDKQPQGVVFGRLSDEAYAKTSEAVQGREGVMQFRTIGPLRRLRENEARAIKLVMRHVVSWLVKREVAMRNSRRCEKPGLREGMMREKMIGIGAKLGWKGEGEAEAWAEAQTIVLERLVVEGVWAWRTRVKEEEYTMKTYPEDDYEGYGGRFRKGGWWKMILNGVEEMLGKQFSAPWDRKAEKEAEGEEGVVEGLVQCVDEYVEKSVVVGEDGRPCGWESLREMVAKMARGWVEECLASWSEEGVVRLV